MKLPRRTFLHLTAGAAALPFTTRLVGAQSPHPPPGPAARELPLAKRLADYAHGLRYEDFDEAAIERVKTHVIDTIGCAIGALNERPVRICREIAVGAAGPSTIVGTNHRATPDLAAFANSAAARYLDFNDTYVGRVAVHPSDNIAACLAVAEAERAGARELITAIVISYEVNCRLVDALDISTRGWDPPIFGLPAVALAVGRLMKLTPEQLTHAVNLAINDHIPLAQTRVGDLSDWKGIAVAETARNAVFAARLARAGLSGPSPIFEGRSGFFQQISGPANVDVGAFGGRSVPFRIHQCSLKPYPAVIYTQTAVVAGIEVAKEVGSLDRISAVEIATTRRGYERTGSEPEKWDPKTRETADHSLPYITARAMFDGDITSESFSQQKFRDPAVLAFMQKIKVSEDPALTARAGGAVPTRVTAILSDGQRITREVDHAPGFAARPMNRSEVERKFRGNIGKRWPKEQTDANLKSLWALDRTSSLTSLLGKLAVPKQA
ncbi:MAG TPA: MmgE/PrpD family protein [Xanthobacteraceae bacterium]|nr:MmgE/PrpD family protein [Xanthobacteraceae bacterium]